MYSIYDIIKIKHDDGRTEIKLCDGTIELLAMELDNIGISLPLDKDDEDAIFDHFAFMDAEIGQEETDGIRATKKYDEQVCRAVDEFNLEFDEFIDYEDVNRRVHEVLESISAGTYKPMVKTRWKDNRNGPPGTCGIEKMTLVTESNTMGLIPQDCDISHQTFTLHRDGRMYWSTSVINGESPRTRVSESYFRYLGEEAAEKIFDAVVKTLDTEERLVLRDGIPWKIDLWDETGHHRTEYGFVGDFRNCREIGDLSKYIRWAVLYHRNEEHSGAGYDVTKHMWLFSYT